MRVAAIDGGYRNLALCIVANGDICHPTHWQVFDLWRKKPGRRGVPTRDDLVRKSVKWCRRHNELLRTCNVIVLENQIREKFIVINCVIQALFFDTCQVVHPMTVGAFFQLPVKREQKKQAGVMLVLANNIVFPKSTGKYDDLADAWMMAVHCLCRCGVVSKNQIKL